MKRKPEEQSELQLDVRFVPNLKAAIDQWLAARDEFKMQPSEENQHEYNATLFGLGAAWAERYPEADNTPEAFNWYRRGLIAPEEDEQPATAYEMEPHSF